MLPSLSARPGAAWWWVDAAHAREATRSLRLGLTATPSPHGLQVTGALSRKRKEETVSTLKEKLNESTVVFGMRHKGLPVRCFGGRHKQRSAQHASGINTQRIAGRASRVTAMLCLGSSTLACTVAAS